MSSLFCLQSAGADVMAEVSVFKMDFFDLRIRGSDCIFQFGRGAHNAQHAADEKLQARELDAVHVGGKMVDDQNVHRKAHGPGEHQQVAAADARFAAGAVVLEEVPPNSTVVGVPARVVRQNGKKVNCSQSLDQIHIPDPVKNKMECLEKRIRELEKLAGVEEGETADEDI